MGESVAEGTIGTWAKKVGEAVRKDEVLVEIETDKVAVEVSAPADGVLSEIVAADGATVTPGQVIGMIATGAAATVSFPAAPAAAAPAPAAAASPAAQTLSPAVQRTAAQTGVDPAQVAATGPKGNILKGDVLAAAASLTAQAPAPVAAAPSAPRPDQPREERVKMTRLRQTIARRLKEAQNNAAMLTTFNEVDMSAVMALRNQY